MILLLIKLKRENKFKELEQYLQVTVGKVVHLVKLWPESRAIADIISFDNMTICKDFEIVDKQLYNLRVVGKQNKKAHLFFRV